MSNPTENSKKSNTEEIGDKHTELNEDQLEQVNGGAFGLKKEPQPYSSHGKGGAGKVGSIDITITK